MQYVASIENYYFRHSYQVHILWVSHLHVCLACRFVSLKLGTTHSLVRGISLLMSSWAKPPKYITWCLFFYSLILKFLKHCQVIGSLKPVTQDWWDSCHCYTFQYFSSSSFYFTYFNFFSTIQDLLAKPQ